MTFKNHSLPLIGLALCLAASAPGQKFYPDDPLTEDPPPLPLETAGYRALSDAYEMFTSMFGQPGERHPPGGVIPSQGVNTLGDVPDGPWFVNRHAKERLTADELVQGPGNETPPSPSGPWRVVAVNKYTARPGLLIQDANQNVYLLRFDPPDRLEMSTGAGMVASRIYHAMGYWVADHYIALFDRSKLVAAEGGTDINAVGRSTELTEEDIDLFLKTVPQDSEGRYRAVALRSPKGAKLLGPYQFYGTRGDDPNDIVSHEMRRDLRGQHVISAWIGNNWISPVQTMDALIEEDGGHFIRHIFVDFLTTLGSSFRDIKHAREGNEPNFDLDMTAKNFIGLGIFVPKWRRAHYPRTLGAGRFEYETFDPASWQPNFETAAVANHLPDDDYWAAKLVMSFTDDDIRAIVKTAQYSDPETEAWIATCLIERRNKIGSHFLNAVLPLDNFRIENKALQFDNLLVRYGFGAESKYTIEWSEFRNFQQEHVPIRVPSSPQIPERAAAAEEGAYFSAKIFADDADQHVTVYLRKETAGLRVIGLDRNWPGKVLAELTEPTGADLHTYSELTLRQRELFDDFVEGYNEKTGFGVTPEEAYSELSLSERSTFGAITHALASSELTDADGKSLGKGIDLLTGIERIAGQYYGRQGDEQFRLYCEVRPDTREILERAQEFSFGEENTVYHVGYPYSYRQDGKVPNMQFSLSEDGLRADIDVDYRDSSIPKAMFNGHLTSANSDVRAGKNYEEHNKRWAGLVNWWEELFGSVKEEEVSETDLMAAQEAVEPATPLPPNRPAGAQVANAYEATQEFLTDWLVRRDLDEAMEWISNDSLSCTKLDDGTDPRTLSHAEARRRLREIMKMLSDEMGSFDNLTQAVDPIIPWRKAFRVIQQPFENDFAIVEAPDSFAAHFRCESRSEEGQNAALAGDLKYGTYYGSLFRFKKGNSRGGVLACLWVKENGNWRILAWEVLSQ